MLPAPRAQPVKQPPAPVPVPKPAPAPPPAPAPAAAAAPAASTPAAAPAAAAAAAASAGGKRKADDARPVQDVSRADWHSGGTVWHLRWAEGRRGARPRPVQATHCSGVSGGQAALQFCCGWCGTDVSGRPFIPVCVQLALCLTIDAMQSAAAGSKTRTHGHATARCCRGCCGRGSETRCVLRAGPNPHWECLCPCRTTPWSRGHDVIAALVSF